MQVQEFKEKRQDGTTFEELLEIQSHIPSLLKKSIIDNVVDISTYQDEDNITKVNYFNKHILKNVLIISNFTNLEFTPENDQIEEFDYLVSIGALEYIIDRIDNSELKFINSVIDDELAQKVKLENSVESVLRNGLNKLIDRLPTDKQLKSLSKSLLKDLGKLDTNKIAELKGMFGGQKVN